MRAGDHQHRDRPRHGVVQASQQVPDQEGDHAGADRHIEQERREAVCQRLRTGAGRLRRFHQALNASQGRLGAHRLDTHAQGGAGHHRARHHAVTHALLHRAGLTGNHGLIEFRRAVNDDAVRRDPRAGTDQDDIANPQGRDGHRLDLGVRHALGLVWQERRQCTERALRLADGAHLLPVPEEHDGHQQGQFPPEIEVEEAEEGGRAGQERHADRQGDEEHHAGGAQAQLVPPAPQKDGPTVEEHDGAQDRRNEIAPGEGGHGEAQPLLHHGAVEHDGDGEHQAEPEAVPEHGHAVPGVLVVPAMFAMRHRRVLALDGGLVVNIVGIAQVTPVRNGLVMMGVRRRCG